MQEIYSISLASLIKELSLDPIFVPGDAEDVIISNTQVDRPGLALTGFLDEFEHTRIQIVGVAEYRYLAKCEETARNKKIESFFAQKPVAVVITSSLAPFDAMKQAAERYGVPFLTTKEKTSPFMAALIAYLNVQLAPRITRHGVLVEVYGEGLLLLGDSGVGKSETAIELVKRGHRLIADDAVEIKRVSAKTLVGTAPPIIRHYVELRGIGIIDVRRIFGMGAVKDSQGIDLVINLEQWIQGKMYDRLGLDTHTMDILGNEVPCITIPVKPGRNLAIILEIAAMNNRQKKMGYNTAEEFNRKLLGQMGLE
ncbi:MAG: HPr(Ser) kinase/phosphatase [Clostridia bacterium]|nr:HPr(Ser) kinase/phosphatase [Clostridia bacterium]MBQ3056418.1 HPr(Ser) kinase/phosphatase [Clostridia bacterium]